MCSILAKRRRSPVFATGAKTEARRQILRRALVATALITVAGVGAWGLSQRLRPMPMPPVLAFLLETRITASLVDPGLLLDRAGVVPGMSVLDAGCGPGRVTLPAARRVGIHGQVVALDGQEAMLEKLRTRLRTEGLANVSPARAEIGAEHLPTAETFDRVLLSMVFGEIRRRRRAFEDLYEATAPGGILSVTETLEPDYHTRGAVRREVEAAGFRFEGVYGGRISYTMNFKRPPARDRAVACPPRSHIPLDPRLPSRSGSPAC